MATFPIDDEDWPIMRCGHKADSIDPNGEFVCSRKGCFGTDNGYDEVR